MTVYWLSFRIHEQTIGGRTYEQRYTDLTETVDNLSKRWWVETTSFLVFDTADNIGPIAQACKKAIAPSHDLFLIREMDTKSAIICGKNDDNVIFELMPYLKKL